MPLFDYACGNCENEFELLVLRKAEPKCPSCGSSNLEKKLSLSAVKSDGTHARALRAAKQRDARVGAERVHAQREYEKNHD
jgi:putative FmdB family regulatory protein